LRVASGEPLPCTQDALSITGWAMEARLYAEDPARGFLPSIGRLDRFDLGDSWRTDTGVERGATISPYYDPMIAKLIAWGPDRDAARQRLAATLDGAAIWPLKTNAGFLLKALNHPAFVAAELDTGLIARAGEALIPAVEPSGATLRTAATALAAPGPLAGFRLNAAPRREGRFLLDGAAVTVPLSPTPDHRPHGDGLIAEQGQVWRLQPWRAVGGAGGEAADGAILSPMPGRIIAVAVAAGERVTKGQKLLTVEAMKMEHSLVAPFDGEVAELRAEEGGQVTEGLLLARIARAGEAA